jgi:hypothetical protein
MVDMVSRLSIMVLALALSGCGLLPKWGSGWNWFGLVKRPPQAPAATLPAWLGRVVMVDAANKFALVDTGAPMRLPAGKRLWAFSDKRRTAVLETTGETRPPFLAVQMVEGTPSLGDQVALDESRPPQAMPSD